MTELVLPFYNTLNTHWKDIFETGFVVKKMVAINNKTTHLETRCFTFHSSIFCLLMSNIDRFNALRDRSLSLAQAGGRK